MKRNIVLVIFALLFTAINLRHVIKAQSITRIEEGAIIRGATNPYLHAIDTTNSVTNILDARDTFGVFGTSSNHAIYFITNGDTEAVISAAGDVGIGTLSPAAGLHGVVTNGAFLWASSEADDTNKQGLWGIEHYDVDEEPFIAIYPYVNSGNNVVRFGGGSASGNAADLISFYTAADDTTTTGTERVQITGTGYFLVSDRIGFISDNDTYIDQDAADRIRFTAGGSVIATLLQDGANDGIYVNAGNVLDMFTNYISFNERATPGAPDANHGRFYVKDNGAGKTVLCAIFNTGGEVCSTELIQP